MIWQNIQKKGIMLIYVSLTITFLGVMFILSPYIQIYGNKQKNDYFLLQARYLSDSGIQKAMARLQQDIEKEFIQKEEIGSCSIQIQKLAEKKWLVHSQSILTNSKKFYFSIKAIIEKRGQKLTILEWREGKKF